MSNKTCWLVDEENGISTDGKRYWCAKKSWKCCEGTIELNHAAQILAKQLFVNDNMSCRTCGSSYLQYDDWDKSSALLQQEYINEAIEELKK